MTISARSPWEKITTDWQQDFADAVGEYQDKYFRWLAARRDYPFLDDPAPVAPMDIHADILARLHAQWTQEFNRRT